VEDYASRLPPDEKQEALQRLELARDFLGSRDPMKYFIEWKTPKERYRSPYADSGDETSG